MAPSVSASGKHWGRKSRQGVGAVARQCLDSPGLVWEGPTETMPHEIKADGGEEVDRVHTWKKRVSGRGKRK